MPDLPLRLGRPPGEPRAKVLQTEAPDLRSLTTLAGAVVVVAGLYLGREVLIPVTLAILLSLVLSPVVRLLRRLRLGRVLAVLLAVLIALGVILATGAVIITQLADLGQNASLYEHTIHAKLETLRSMTLGRLGTVLERVGEEFSRPTPAPPGGTQGAPAGGAGTQAPPPPLPVEVHQPELTPTELLNRLISPLVGPLAQAGIVLVVTVFVLLQREDLRDRLIRLFGATDLHRTTVAMDDAAYRLSRFFLAQLTINFGFGTLIGLGLLLIGVPNPVLWGILAALLRFVPYVGAILGAVLPIALAAAVDPGWSMVLWTAALFLALEPLVGHVVEPLAYGHSTGMSPVSVVVAAIFWSWIWGPIGLIIATPVTLCLVVIGRHVERLEFLDVLLGDRPALTPVENFYQRALAGDPDEALEQAEALLRERSLSSYYDEVALKGLALAAVDVQRGLVTPPQLERIREAVTDLSEALDGEADVPPAPAATQDSSAGRILRLSAAEQRLPKSDPPPLPDPASIPEPWRRPGAVLCVAGRGPLDEVSASLLAQILRKHGLGVRVVPHAAVSRREVQRLDTEGVLAIFVCTLQVTGSPSHLRYLLQRLHHRMPEVPLLAGIWAEDNAVVMDENFRQSLPTSRIVTSLQEAVMACGHLALEEHAQEPA